MHELHHWNYIYSSTAEIPCETFAEINCNVAIHHKIIEKKQCPNVARMEIKPWWYIDVSDLISIHIHAHACKYAIHMLISCSPSSLSEFCIWLLQIPSFSCEKTFSFYLGIHYFVSAYAYVCIFYWKFSSSNFWCFLRCQEADTGICIPDHCISVHI